MFKRILHEEWATVIPIIAFAFTFTIFIVAIVRSVRMKKATREHMSALPLEDDSTATH
jgi:amino acid permease